MKQIIRAAGAVRAAAVNFRSGVAATEPWESGAMNAMSRFFSILMLGAMTVPGYADPGDPGGWFVDTDPRGRAFLTWTPVPDGPRLLMFGCLKDAGTFTTMSAAVNPRATAEPARLSLTDRLGTFSVDGEVVFYPRDRRSTFISDLDADTNRMRSLGSRLVPVLMGAGPLKVTITSSAYGNGLADVELPTRGLELVLPSFLKVCF